MAGWRSSKWRSIMCSGPVRAVVRLGTAWRCSILINHHRSAVKKQIIAQAPRSTAPPAPCANTTLHGQMAGADNAAASGKFAPTRKQGGHRRDRRGFGAKYARPEPQTHVFRRARQRVFFIAESALRADQQRDGAGGLSKRALRGAGGRVEYQLERGRLCQPVAQAARCGDDRDAIAAALFAGAHRYRVPVLNALVEPFAGELYAAAFGEERNDAAHAEFHRFLHRVVHALAARNALGQPDVEG